MHIHDENKSNNIWKLGQNDGETALSGQWLFTATGERWIEIMFEGIIAQFDLEYVIFNSSYNLDGFYSKPCMLIVTIGRFAYRYSNLMGQS